MAQFIDEVRVTHHGQGHIKVKVKCLHPFQFYVAYTVQQADGLHLTEMHSCCCNVSLAGSGSVQDAN